MTALSASSRTRRQGLFAPGLRVGHLLPALAALCLTGPGATARAAEAPAVAAPAWADAHASQTLAPVALRGYGTLSATFSTPAQPAGASVLDIACENAAKAQLVQAKHLSDLGSLPGVTEASFAAAGGQVACRTIAGQGVIAALRSGTRVVVLAATKLDDLAALYARQFPAVAVAPVSKPDGVVPMYLDRWDKYGFRFYYRAWECPVGQWKTYDIPPEFDFAQAHQTGFVFWDNQNQVDTAQGMMDHVWFDWAQNTARARGLPVAINITASVNPWLQDAHRDQEQQKMPQFCGTYYRLARSDIGGSGALSWNARDAEDQELSVLQTSVRRFVADSNVVSFLEPHGELSHGIHDIFLEYGPVADAGYRTYLQQQYKTVSALGTRWFGDAAHFKTWQEVHVPEVAEFLGWGPQALDASGAWRVGYSLSKDASRHTDGDRKALAEKTAVIGPPPQAWYQPEFDDHAWPTVVSGHDRTFFIPKEAAVYRRLVDVPASWRASRPQVWLYVWDLNNGWNQWVDAWVNGQKVGHDMISHPAPHWAAFDVGKALQGGQNLVALYLPNGYLAYRVYLSPDAPTQYPNLGAGRNAQWVDFVDWQQWSRVETARRGIQMIRQAAPNHPITLMHPDEFSEGIKKLAEDYGAEFHNTGYMCDWYADYNPLLMQGSGLPFSVEPDHPAGTAGEFKQMLGRWFSEGVQSIDYYIHIGSVMWFPDIESHFESIQNLVHLVGKYHAPPAEIAVLMSSRLSALTGYPWGNDPNVNLGAGYWAWNIGTVLRDRYPFDGITESDFARGAAGRYKVIVDANTSIMDDALVDAIEHYVRAGGTFITYVQTGRHSPVAKDVWPISRLTGYTVIRNAQYDTTRQYGDWDDKAIPDAEWHNLKPAPGQTVFAPADWAAPVRANGLALEKTAPDCQDLMLWEDGSVAVGMRPLGKGIIIEVGAKFGAKRMWDRLDPTVGNTPGVQNVARLYRRLMDWRGMVPTPAHLGTNGAPEGPIILRRWLSNNGLYDVWTLWNQGDAAVATDLIFDGGLSPASAIDVQSGQSLAVTSGAAGPRLAGLRFEPLQTRVFLTPRQRVSAAGLDWFKLQRSWWRGSLPAPVAPLPEPPHDRSLDLVDDWAFKPLETAADGEPLAAAETDDKSWERMRLGVWNLPDHRDVHHAIFRKHFTVPREWTSGRVDLWLQAAHHGTFAARGRVWLDGKLIKDWKPEGGHDGICANDGGGVLTPGSAHVLAVEIAGEVSLQGVRGGCWLAYRPAPATRLDLAGDWSPSADALRYDAPIRLPGDFKASSLRRHVVVGAEYAGQNVVLSVDGGFLGVLINGRYESRSREALGDRWSLNITPWVHVGGDNEIELSGGSSSAYKGALRGVSLDFYNPAVYP